ncbi:acyltransferase 3 [Enterobacter cancerogenus]|uniref:Acyltransferase 3 n=1 Tax=Enterobacter cancerogenus TaxID=69218 RepID=A0A484X5T9_9ENTR|nr:acyltransferase 3 [Enterobacter cancerogenus]
MPVFFFISGYLIRRYIDEVDWRTSLDKRIWSIVWVLALWGVLQWQALSHLNAWLAPERELTTSSNAAYADSISGFLHGMLTASTSLWYLYALVVYFTLCKLLSRWKLPVLALLALASVAINFLPLPWWGMNSVVRNMIYYSLGAWYGAQLMAWMKGLELRRYGLAIAAFAMVSVVLWFANVPLFLSAAVDPGHPEALLQRRTALCRSSRQPAQRGRLEHHCDLHHPPHFDRGTESGSDR